MSKKNRSNKPVELLAPEAPVEALVEDAAVEAVEVLEEEAVVEALVEDAAVEAVEVLEEEAVVEESVPEAPEAPVEASVEEVPTDSRFGPLMELQSAAQILIDGFTVQWLPNLLSFARHNGLPEQCPLAVYHALFKAWGAKFK